ncbi:hypothetical protein AB4144_58335, partial [Rhizobiaceae sp. 2RAB30]
DKAALRFRSWSSFGGTQDITHSRQDVENLGSDQSGRISVFAKAMRKDGRPPVGMSSWRQDVGDDRARMKPGTIM